MMRGRDAQRGRPAQPASFATPAWRDRRAARCGRLLTVAELQSAWKSWGSDKSISVLHTQTPAGAPAVGDMGVSAQSHLLGFGPCTGP